MLNVVNFFSEWGGCFQLMCLYHELCCYFWILNKPCIHNRRHTWFDFLSILHLVDLNFCCFCLFIYLDLGNWTLTIIYARHTLYHWGTPPTFTWLSNEKFSHALTKNIGLNLSVLLTSLHTVFLNDLESVSSLSFSGKLYVGFGTVHINVWYTPQLKPSYF